MGDSLVSGDTSLAIQLAHNTSTALVAEGPKRKSRWSSIQVAKRGKRWGHIDDKPYKPVSCAEVPSGLTAKEIDQLLREMRLEVLTQRMADGELEDMDPDIRPPSPPPTYDKDGNRTNTRDVRLKRVMDSEYQRLVRYAIRNIIGYTAPTDWRPKKLSKKILVPVDKYPQISFIGIIVGPRGVNHKRMQEESGAKITIRGKDISDKWQTEEEMNMQQHVHIEADFEEQIEAAEKMVAPLLDPESKEFMTQRDSGQLQLAKVVGFTIDKAEVRCMICLATGHYSYECPDAPFNNFQANVMCTICGDKGHVAMDCPQKIAKAKERTKETILEEAKLEKEYADLMGDLGVEAPAPAAGAIQAVTPAPGGKNIGADFLDSGLTIHPSQCSKFIGKAGAHVQALQTSCGVKITVEPGQPGQDRRVLISGEEDARENAIQEIKNWLEQNKVATTPIPGPSGSAWANPRPAPPAAFPSPPSWAPIAGKGAPQWEAPAARPPSAWAPPAGAADAMGWQAPSTHAMPPPPAWGKGKGAWGPPPQWGGKPTWGAPPGMPQ